MANNNFNVRSKGAFVELIRATTTQLGLLSYEANSCLEAGEHTCAHYHAASVVSK
jgi:hypothetical protein